jgi:spoIIIJ-associated protein
MRSYEVIAKTVDDAIEQALTALNTTIDEVEIEIFEETQKGLFGFLKSKEVRVVASLKQTVMDQALSFLKDMLTGMGVDATFEIVETTENLTINILGEDMAIVIGRRGQTLDALQYLVSLVINKGRDSYLRVVLDTENYRSKREASLIKLANKLAYKAKKYRKEIILEPMNPYERRIIHASLQSNKFVSTRSEGDEPNRKVIIFLNK